MSEEEQPKRKRGRPRKITPPEAELVTEERKVLIMSDEDKKQPSAGKPEEKKSAQRVTIDRVKRDLVGLYDKVYNFSQNRTNSGWLDALGTLNEANPFLQNQRLKQISTTPSPLSTEEILSMIDAPQNSEIPLRGAGWSLSSSQYIYYQILRLAADVPMFNYYKTPPLLEEEEDYKSKEFMDEDEFLDDWLHVFDVKNTLKRVALETKREGKSTYVFRNSVHEEGGKKVTYFATWQKLPSDYVKLSAIGKHGYIASFNMMLFMNPAFNISQYPDFIRDIWEGMTKEGGPIKINPTKHYTIDPTAMVKFQYRDPESGLMTRGIFESKRDVYLYWVRLPQEFCYTFASDSSHPWAIPDTAGLFSNLQELTDYSTLAGLVQSTPLTAMLTGEVETIEDPEAGSDQTIINPQTIVGIQNEFNSKTSTNVEAFFAPFKNLKLQSLPNIPNATDIQTKAVQNFVSLAGEGGILTVNDKPSVAQVHGAQLMEEAKYHFVTLQFESVLNMIINNFLGCKYRWKLHLWGGIFTFSDEVQRDKEMWQSGATFLLPKIASAYDMSVRDVQGTSKYIKATEAYGNFETLTQETQAKLNQKKTKSQNAEVAATTNKVGRPRVSLGEIDNDNTEASVSQGTNTSDMRDYIARGQCICCGKPIDGYDAYFCEECREQYIDESDE